MVCGIFVASLLVGVSQLRYSDGYNKGYAGGYQDGQSFSTGHSFQAGIVQGNRTGYLQGYQDGLQVNNGTG